MDFAVGLPHTQGGYDSIWVIVARLTKSAHFLSRKDYLQGKSSCTVVYFRICELHGMLSSIVSDRDPKFISKFWKVFQQAMRSRSYLSTSNHPQTDG